MRGRRTLMLGMVVAAALTPLGALGAQIASVTPRVAAPGDEVEIRGRAFSQHQGRWQVTMTRVVDHRPERWGMTVLDWSDGRIRARVPAGAPSDGYLVLVSRSDRPTLHSNTVVLEVRGPGEDASDARYSMDGQYERAAIGSHAPPDAKERKQPRLPWLESLEPSTVRPGDTLRLRGRDFGDAPDGRVVGINRGRVREAAVLSWSDREVRVRVPGGLRPGEYRVLVYWDQRYDVSSNTLGVQVR